MGKDQGIEVILTVSELVSRIKGTLEENMGNLWVQGEISNLVKASSGHCYMVLKDSSAQLRAVMWRYIAKSLSFEPKDGDEVLAYGQVTVYQPRGELQMVISRMMPRGIGELQLAFQALKEKLQKEGLFAAEHKKPLPAMPKKIGIVTSPTGAAIRDMIRNLTNRFPNIQVLIYPVMVQGEGAAQQIAAAIEHLNKRNDIDLIIVGRGGGSIEDLWAFNEEAVARAIFASQIPIISAVGHETDFTIADFVADVRAATPTEAAVLAVPDKRDKLEALRSLRLRLINHVQNRLQLYSETLGKRLTRNLISAVTRLINQGIQGIDNLDYRLRSLIVSDIKLKRNLLYSRSTQIADFHPAQVISSQHEQVSRLTNRMVNLSTWRLHKLKMLIGAQLKPNLRQLGQKAILEMKGRVSLADNKLRYLTRSLLKERLTKNRQLLRYLYSLAPSKYFSQRRKGIRELENRLKRTTRGYLANKQELIRSKAQLIYNLGPGVLFAKGYAILRRKGETTPITDPESLQLEDTVEALVNKGYVEATVTGKKRVRLFLEPPKKE